MVITAPSTRARRWNEPKHLPVGEWTGSLSYEHDMGYYAAMNRNGVLILATTRMNLETVMLSARRQSQKNYTLNAPVYMKGPEQVNPLKQESRFRGREEWRVPCCFTGAGFYCGAMPIFQA